MKLRILQMINNLYIDDATEKQLGNKALGEYCVFGYFDAMQVDTVKKIGAADSNPIWQELNRLSLERLDGSCTRRNIVGIIMDDQKDEEFWSSESNRPMLFISLIRIDHRKKDGIRTIQDTIEKINQKPDMIAYYSHDHSEMIVLRREKSYRSGMQTAFELRGQLGAYKLYTIFAVREDVLASLETIRLHVKEEQVNCRLIGVVKDMEAVPKFAASLYERLKEGLMGKLKVYKTLGSGDVLIEINDVSLHHLLSCYKMKEILTHGNPCFNEAFFNVETDIIASKETACYG